MFWLGLVGRFVCHDDGKDVAQNLHPHRLQDDVSWRCAFCPPPSTHVISKISARQETNTLLVAESVKIKVFSMKLLVECFTSQNIYKM